MFITKLLNKNCFSSYLAENILTWQTRSCRKLWNNFCFLFPHLWTRKSWMKYWQNRLTYKNIIKVLPCGHKPLSKNYTQSRGHLCLVKLTFCLFTVRKPNKKDLLGTAHVIFNWIQLRLRLFWLLSIRWIDACYIP